MRLILTIPEEGPIEVGVDRPTPTATPTSTPTPTSTSTPTPTPTSTSTATPIPPTPTPTPTPTLEPTPEPEPSPGNTVGTMGFFLSLVTLSLVGGVLYTWVGADEDPAQVAYAYPVLAMFLLGATALIVVFVQPLAPLNPGQSAMISMGIHARIRSIPDRKS